MRGKPGKRDKAQRALVESEERYRLVFEMAPDPVLVRRGERIVFANPAAVRFFGARGAEDLTGKSLLTLIHPDERDEAARRISLIEERGGATPAVERRFVRIDGVEVVGETSASEVTYGGERMAIMAIHDVTERLRHQSEIERLNAELDRRVAERTAQLQEVNRELEAFSYSVSHDLRAPLRGIEGFSQALLEDYADKLDQQGRDFLNRIRACTGRMAELIEDLLALARVTRAEMRRASVDLSAMAREIAAELQKMQPERKVEFDIAPDLIVEGDPNLLRTMLENLLGNAWKFSGKRPQAKIQLGAARQEAGTVYFVRDNGAGFDMAYAAKLFGAFQRLHAATEFPGTGIGLATVQRIVRRHDGRVWAESALGAGATFYFTLP